MLGKTIKLYLVDGSPKGIIAAEIMNWTGSVFAIPRLKLAEFVKREEATRTGLYILTNANADHTEVYIGETDSLKDRLLQHNNKEPLEDWRTAFVISSKDFNITKAHVKYLESEVIQLAKQLDRVIICNRTAPIFDKLPEADTADMQYFLSQIRLVLPVLGLTMLQPQATTQQVEETIENNKTTEVAWGGRWKAKNDLAVLEDSPVFTISGRGYEARGQIVDGEFVIFKGALLRKDVAPSFPSGFKALRNDLLQRGKLEEIATHYKLTTDFAFKSTSGAAVFIVGRTANGRIEWKVENTGQAFADWEETATA